MLQITVPKTRLFNEKDSTFIRIEEQKLKLEHSLISISNWESKWHVPFFGEGEKTKEMIVDYIRCMTLTPNVDENVYLVLASKKNLVDQISEYIHDPMTASWIRRDEKNKGGVKRVITSELIYYWMFSYQIPKDCEKWHINRLIMLIEIFNAENSEKKSPSKSDMLAQRKKLNAQRRKAAHSRG